MPRGAQPPLCPLLVTSVLKGNFCLDFQRDHVVSCPQVRLLFPGFPLRSSPPTLLLDASCFWDFGHSLFPPQIPPGPRPVYLICLSWDFLLLNTLLPTAGPLRSPFPVPCPPSPHDSPRSHCLLDASYQPPGRPGPLLCVLFLHELLTVPGGEGHTRG